MATWKAKSKYINSYRTLKLQLDAKGAILRSALGETSYDFLKPIFDRLNTLIERSEETLLLEEIPSTVLNDLSVNIEKVVNSLKEIAAFTEDQFTDSTIKEKYSDSIHDLYDKLMIHWPHFISAELRYSEKVTSNFWQTQLDERIFQAEIRLTEKIAAELDNHISNGVREVNDARKEVKELTKQIQDLHAETATDAALKTVKQQFNTAVEEAKKSRNLWAWLGGSAVVIFFILLWLFATLFQPEYHNNSEGFHWSAVYSTLIRLTVLTAVAAVVSFCAKMYRAHSHLYEHARHRLRTANSYSTFIDSAKTEDQRDVILSKLVDTITHFGNSGLLQTEDDAIHPSKMTIETFNKSLSAATKSN